MQSRREFLLAAFAAGAIITAEGLWIPGQRLISISKKHLILSESRISIVDEALGRVLCSLPRTMDAVDIRANVARMIFPEVHKSGGIAGGVYVGKTRVADVDGSFGIADGMTVEVIMHDLTPEIVMRALV